MSNRPRIESAAPIPYPDGLENLVALTLFLPVGVLAAVTVITHISQLFELPFRVYAYFSVAVSALFVIPTTYRLAREVATTSPSQRKNGLSLILLGLTGATLAVVSNRASIDDYGYLANARYFLEYPATPLNLDIHYLFSKSEPFRSLTWATSNPYEFLYAALDFVFGVDFLWAYYVLGATVIGFLIPLALYSLTRVFVADHAQAFFGVMVALLLVILLFEANRTFGNYSFVRAFQGEVFVLTICLPALAAASLRFLTDRCLFHWAMVLSICVAGLGASASSIILLPPLGLTIVGALWGGPISRRAFTRRVILYGSAFAYLVVYGVIYRLYFASDLGLDSPAHAGWPRSFLRHLAFFWPPGTRELPPPGTLDSIFLSLTPIPYTPVAVTLSIVSAIGLSSGWTRRFLLTWLSIVISLFLNPWSGDILIRYFTGPNIYWRMFYLLPFPLAAAIVGASLHTRIEERFGQYLSWAGLGAFAALSFLNLWARDLIELPPRYKLPHAEYETAAIVVEQAPPGPMLAPSDVAGIVAILSADHPQISIRIRGFIQATLLTAQGRPREALYRGRAGSFVRFGQTEDYGAFETVLARYPLAAVVLHQRVFDSRTRAVALLKDKGFCAVPLMGDYKLFVQDYACNLPWKGSHGRDASRETPQLQPADWPSRKLGQRRQGMTSHTKLRVHTCQAKVSSWPRLKRSLSIRTDSSNT